MTTIKDVAEKAGVSTGTVDRILHKRGRFSEDTARRVYKAVEELGYRPNLLARNLSTSKTCRIAVIVPKPEQDSNYWSLPLSGVERAVEKLSVYHVKPEFFSFDRYDREGFAKVLALVDRKDFDGILMAPLIEEESRRFLERMKLPVVFIDTDLKGTDRAAYVGQDSRKGGQLAGRLLNLLSRDREGDYLIITPPTENIHLSGRIEGFTDSVSRGYRLFRTAIEAASDREEFFARLDGQSVDSLGGIYITDASAHHTADYLKERGLEHLPLVGFDLVEENRAAVQEGVIDFILTQQPVEQGYQAVNLLYRLLLLGEKPGDQIMSTQIVTKENLPE